MSSKVLLAHPNPNPKPNPEPNPMCSKDLLAAFPDAWLRHEQMAPIEVRSDHHVAVANTTGASEIALHRLSL